MIKKPGLKNPETYVLTHNRFNTCLVLNFSDLNKAQIYKMPYSDSPDHEIEVLMSFNYLNLSKPNEHTEDCYKRRPNDKNFLYEIDDRKYVYVVQEVFKFETTDKIVEHSSNDGLNDLKYTYAHGITNR